MTVATFSETVRKRGYLYFYSGAKSNVERLLSTFHPAKVVYRGVEFPSIEHAFQAAKYLHSDRPELFPTIALIQSAKNAKRAGGKGAFKVRGAKLDVPSWTAHSVDVMTELVESRARYDKLYRSILKKSRKDGITLLHYEKAFGKRGAEPFWGGYFRKDTGDFFGKNHLGKIMMKVAQTL